MIVEPVDVALGTVGMPPVGALHERPPLAPVAQIDVEARLHEDQRAGIEHVGQGARVILRVGWNLGDGLVTGRKTNRLN